MKKDLSHKKYELYIRVCNQTIKDYETRSVNIEKNKKVSKLSYEDWVLFQNGELIIDNQPELEIEQTVWTIKPFKDFVEIDILQNENGFKYHVQFQLTYGPVSFLIFKNCIIGGMEYLCNKKTYALREVKYFETYEECVEELKTITLEQIQDLIRITGENYPLKKHTIFGYKNI